MKTTTAASAGGIAAVIVWLWNDVTPAFFGVAGGWYPTMPAEVAATIGPFVLALGARLVDRADD